MNSSNNFHVVFMLKKTTKNKKNKIRGKQQYVLDKRICNMNLPDWNTKILPPVFFMAMKAA